MRKHHKTRTRRAASNEKRYARSGKMRGSAAARERHLSARYFLQAFLAMERPNSIHLFYSKGILDFLTGVVIGIVIGMIIAAYI